MAVWCYQEVAGVGEALAVLGGEGDDEGAELADGDGDEAGEDERPVAVAGGEKLRADAAVLGEDLGGGGARLDVEHVVDPLEAEDLELAREAEQHAHQEEHARAVHPRRHRGHQRHRAPRHADAGEGERRLDAYGGEEEYGLVRGLDAERREEQRGEEAERAVQLRAYPRRTNAVSSRSPPSRNSSCRSRRRGGRRTRARRTRSPPAPSPGPARRG